MGKKRTQSKQSGSISDIEAAFQRPGKKGKGGGKLKPFLDDGDAPAQPCGESFTTVGTGEFPTGRDDSFRQARNRAYAQAAIIASQFCDDPECPTAKFVKYENVKAEIRGTGDGRRWVAEVTVRWVLQRWSVVLIEVRAPS